MAPPSAAQAIAIVGTGRMAQALGRLLHEEGEPVACVAGRSPGRARVAAEFIGPGVPAVSISEAGRIATRFLMAVSDSALEKVAETLAGAVRPGGIALHTCGARDEDVLGALEARGVSCGTLHPLQTIADRWQAGVLRRATFAISGNEGALCWARDIVRRLGGTALAIRPGGRAVYHAAAVMASNYVVAIIDTARELMAAASGEQPEVCLRAIEPLVRASVTNAFECGPAGALTGPIERGDAGTVKLHLAALGGAVPAAESLYRAAGLQALEIARRKGLEAAKAAQLEAILRGKEVS